MKISTPEHNDIISLQQRQGAYYFSAATEVVLRKHGLVLGSDGPLIITRNVSSLVERPDKPMLIEGRMTAELAAELGVQVSPAQATELHLASPSGDLIGTLRYHRSVVRAIPQHRGENSEPYQFVSIDPLWNPATIEFQTFASNTGRPVLLGSADTRGPWQILGVALDGGIALGIPLLDVLVQQHTAPPYDAGFYETLNPPEGRTDIEDLLIGWLLDLGGHRTDIWPPGQHASLTVRHDYDRPISDERLASLLAFYTELGIKSTWFWRLVHPHKAQIQSLLRAGHEVALHTEARTPLAFQTEVALLRDLAGVAPRGYSAHGGIPAPGNLGLHQIEWAEELGMVYGERLGANSRLPHYAVVITNGVPAPSRLILPARHYSLDVSMTLGAHRLESLLPDVQGALDSGEQVVVMNHPDLHTDALTSLLSRIRLTRVWRATLSECAEWVRAGSSTSLP